MKQDQAYPGLSSVLIVGIWFGFLTGILEILIIGLRKAFFGHPIFLGLDRIWMTPLVGIVILTGVDLALWLAGHLAPRLLNVRNVILVNSIYLFFNQFLIFQNVHKLAAAVLSIGLAYQLSGWIAAHPHLLSKFIGRTLAWPSLLTKQRNSAAPPVHTSDLVVPAISRRDFLIGTGSLLGSLALSAAGWERWLRQPGQPPSHALPKSSPNILLIVLDTIRAQSLGLYGYERNTSPNLQRLAQKGVVFDRSFATSPWTLPSHASFFTGRLPDELSVDWERPLNHIYPTLAETLHALGYTTAGFVSNVIYCSHEFGLSRGFSHYLDFPISAGEFMLSSSLVRDLANNQTVRKFTDFYDVLGRKNAERINQEFLHWLAEKPDGPFFAFLNYFDAHEPYMPPKSFTPDFSINLQRNPGHLRFWNHEGAMTKWDGLSAEEVQAEKDAYETTIAYLDHQVGVLTDTLEAQGKLENTILIILSDHGEQFGEKGLYSHGNSLYLTTLHVPLLLSFPPTIPAGKRVKEAISLREIPNTILDLIGASENSPFPGASLRRYWQNSNEETLPMESVVVSELKSESPISARESSRVARESVVSGSFHYILYSDSSEELYDFEADPWEQQSLHGDPARSGLMSRFRKMLQSS